MTLRKTELAVNAGNRFAATLAGPLGGWKKAVGDTGSAIDCHDVLVHGPRDAVEGPGDDDCQVDQG